VSACEKCWRDAEALVRAGEAETKADGYRRLLGARTGTAEECAPEEQAGPDATLCESCQRRTRHQITGECMKCGRPRGEIDELAEARALAWDTGLRLAAAQDAVRHARDAVEEAHALVAEANAALGRDRRLDA
jgi:hypothetical protein